MKKVLLFSLSIIIILSLTACEKKLKEKATYRIEASGMATEAGVIGYVDYEMNVYKDLASNPCGSCDDQPISIYAGATAEETLIAIENAIKRADDVWIVKERQSNFIVLEERIAGESKKPEKLTAPKGLVLKGEYKGAK